MTRFARTLNAIWIYILCGVLLGAFSYEIAEDQLPCSLCLLQRLGMIGVSLGAMLNLRFGIKARHYAFALASAILGGAVSLRQISLHVCPQFPTFGIPVFGYELYTWAFIVALCSGIGITLLLFLYKEGDAPERLNTFEWIAIYLMGAVCLANLVTTLVQCGIGPCA